MFHQRIRNIIYLGVPQTHTQEKKDRQSERERESLTILTDGRKKEYITK